MSDIAGIYHRDGRPVDITSLSRMVSYENVWNTDGTGTWIDGAIGLAHRMHQVTPESVNERYPLSIEDRIILTADARIDNRNELISCFGLKLNENSTITDADLILLSYEKWGEKCPQYLIGDFAFAIWDNRNHCLFIARDPMGVKPFFYMVTPHVFIFGSSIRSILQLTEYPQRLNKLQVAFFLNGIDEDNEITFYEGIKKLKPAYCVLISNDGMNAWRYWNPVTNPPIRFRNNEEYAEALKEIFFEAVNCRLRSNLPVGTFLSGGLDSTSVTCVARSIMDRYVIHQPLHAFSAVFPDIAKLDPRIDERSYISKVAENPNIISHMVVCDKTSPFLEYSWNNDEPSSHTNSYILWSISESARLHGIRILLTGTDGDTTVSYGYEYFQELIIKLRWIKMLHEASALSRITGGAAKDIIFHCGLKPLIPESLITLWHKLKQKDNISAFQIYRMKPKFIKEIAFVEHLQQILKKQTNTYLPWDQHKYNIMQDIIAGLMDSYQQIRNVVGIDFRHPFFDRRMLDFCTAVPLAQKLQNGYSRSIFRRSMNDIIPKDIQWRARKGWLSACFDINFLAYEKDMIQDMLYHHSYLINEYIYTEDIVRDFQTYAMNPLKHSRKSYALFSVLTLIYWLIQSQLS